MSKHRAPETASNKVSRRTVVQGLLFGGVAAIAGTGTWVGARGFESQYPGFISRAEIGIDESKRANRAAPTLMESVNGITVHHTADCSAGCDVTSDSEAEAERVVGVYNTALQTDGGGGINYSDIPYHAIVGESGAKYAGRSPFSASEQVNLGDDAANGRTANGKFARGAHVFGDNDSTYSIAVLGNFVAQRINRETYRSIVEICSWQCLESGIDPNGQRRVQVPISNGMEGQRVFVPGGQGEAPTEEVTFMVPNINGHQDAFNTQCPGTIQELLPSIRRDVAIEMRRVNPERTTEILSLGRGVSLGN